jgi:hypothetical protein
MAESVELLDRHEAAQLLRRDARTLLRWHRSAYGPTRFSGYGREVGYRKADVDEWAAYLGCFEAD